MIEVKNLVKKYGSHLAVDHLNFTVINIINYGFIYISHYIISFLHRIKQCTNAVFCVH